MQDEFKLISRQPDTGKVPEYLTPATAAAVRRFHESFPQYAPTPLAELSETAKVLRVGNIWVKDESRRFGLNAFKVLGGSYAMGKILAQRLGISMDQATCGLLTDPATRERLGDITFVTATDGNHGRGIAWSASQFRQKSVVYMPRGSARERLENIRAAGADASIIDGNYDDAVRLASRMAEKQGWILVQDTAWEGYEDIPRWIMEGYCTMGLEALEQLPEAPTHIFLQAGVGSMAGAMAGLFTAAFGEKKPVITIVEPNKADCLFRTAQADDGKLHFVTGDMDTIMAGLADWDEYALNLEGTAIAAELTTNDFNLYNEAGELKAIGNCYESFGIIVNTKLLGDAGYSLTDITNFETLKAVAEDIHARAAELGFDAFSAAGLDGSSSWRFSGHLATLPLHYEGVNASVPAITGEKLDLFKNVWDLYINNSAADVTSLTTSTGDESKAQFVEGKAVFYQNGTWEYAGLIEAGMTDEELAMIPIYCGAEGEENAALCSGTENCWAINAKASAEDIQASIDFLVWLVSDADASAVYVAQLGAVPFKNCPASTNKFVNDGNAMLAEGKTSISWAFNYTPNVDAWRATVVTALAAYSAGTAEWSMVEEAFVDGWAYEYSVVNG